MCLIILREPNVELDYKKFTTAVMNNPHGWGISVPDTDGRLYTHRQIETDTEELYAMLHKEFKADRLMLHLRYTTAGDTVLRNAHPFPVCEADAHGADIRMAHNGTLFDYTPGRNANNSWESDTRVFAREFVRPLFTRLSKGMTSEEILEDRFVNRLIDGELTTMSVATFIDGYGNTSIVNATGNGGYVDKDGTYYSNKYSFDEDHRKPKGSSVYTMGKGTTSSTTSGSKSTTGTTTAGTAYTKFTDKHGIEDMDDLFQLGDDTLDAMLQESPEDILMLTKELLCCLYIATNKHDRASKLIAKKTAEISNLRNELKEKTKDVSENA